jgi:dipeptidase
VDTGFVSPEKRSATSQYNTPFRARISNGPGVFMSGAGKPPTNPWWRFDAAAVRHGNPSVAVPL